MKNYQKLMLGLLLSAFVAIIVCKAYPSPGDGKAPAKMEQVSTFENSLQVEDAYQVTTLAVPDRAEIKVNQVLNVDAPIAPDVSPGIGNKDLTAFVKDVPIPIEREDLIAKGNLSAALTFVEAVSRSTLYSDPYR